MTETCPHAQKQQQQEGNKISDRPPKTCDQQGSSSEQKGTCPARGCRSSSSFDALASIANAKPLSYVDPSTVAQQSPSPESTSSTPSDSDSSATSALPVHRQVSSIPRSVDNDTEEYWVYPSQLQFYQAMHRKNYSPREDDMSVIVPVHNAINEMAWMKVMEWEKKYAETCERPVLKKFVGKPDELSPKARIRNLLGWSLPFDRHDWTIDRCGQDVTYILDFYQGKDEKSLLSVHIDVRPDLKRVENVLDRMQRWASQYF